MIRPLRPLPFALLVVIIGLGAVQAQRPTDGTPAPRPNGGSAPAVAPGTPRVTDKPAPGAEPRDPTRPSPDLKKALDAGKPAPGGVAPAAPTAGLVTLRARVIARDVPPIAYIEVNKQQYVIGPDSKLTIGNMTYKVLEISATQVRLMVEPLDEILVLR